MPGREVGESNSRSILTSMGRCQTQSALINHETCSEKLTSSILNYAHGLSQSNILHLFCESCHVIWLYNSKKGFVSVGPECFWQSSYLRLFIYEIRHDVGVGRWKRALCVCVCGVGGGRLENVIGALC